MVDPNSIGTATISTEEPQPGSTRWEPVVGPETIAFLERNKLSNKADEQSNLEEAVGILSRCISPVAPGPNSTGLTIGYVQSGKTRSFTLVTALARDNQFALIVVIAGTSIPLFEQSVARLGRDLRLDERADRAWMPLSNPTLAEKQRLLRPFDEWRDPEGTRQAVFLTVMKNHNHLRNLNDLLEDADLDGIPTLIIDDEADQASLNTRARRHEQSATYREILKLRHLVPTHSFLQYTATPQAPLLISLIDTLSPEFAQLLTPGSGYTGGKQFFLDRDDIVCTIPDSELPIPANALTGPPATLKEALRLFFLGVSAEYVRTNGQLQVDNRSMLIHPSQGVIPHAQYGTWVKAMQESWAEYLDLPTGDSMRDELVAQFQVAFDGLSKTVSDLPAFEDLMHYLRRAIRGTVITIMNAAAPRGTPRVVWRESYSHILIGGQAMDRGFTVEGLTVTYMPRSVGVGNVDTIQQRARFFGYKAGYFGFCRVYLEGQAYHAYREYVHHEESIRKELTEYGDRPLTEWKRAFLLDSRFSPTRRNILGVEYTQGDYADKWFKPSAPHRDRDAVIWNNAVVDAFVSSVGPWHEDDGSPDRTEPQKHSVADVSLEGVLNELLAPTRMVHPTDSVKFTGLLMQVKSYLEGNPDDMARIYRMSSGHERQRGLDDDDEIINLHQGRDPRTGPIRYPGDAKIRDEQRLSVQIHYLRVKETLVRALAIWVPAAMSDPWLVGHN